MRVLILGGTGMLGHKLYQSLEAPLDVWVTTRGKNTDLAKYSFFCPDRVIGGVSAESLESVAKAIDHVKPAVVINCIGIIKQQPLGKDPIACLSINALFPHQLASLCGEKQARLIHISTDCVFAGTRGGYFETDLTDAEDLYGRTKALGETQAPNALTLRTSIIGRELSQGFGLVEWFLSNRGGRVCGFTKAIFSGLTTIELARVIQNVIVEHPALTGLHQVATTPIDKFTLLNLIDAEYATKTQILPSDELHIDRSLVGTRFNNLTGYRPPSWPEMIREMAADMTPYHSWRDN
jgi:dTDP-4-dehydrorhamnose reductase